MVTVALKFTEPFAQQDTGPDCVSDAAMAVLQSGRPHRSTRAEAEGGDVSALASGCRDWQGCDVCLAVVSGGGQPVPEKINENLRPDRKIGTNGARVLLLSQMCGHPCDMNRFIQTCDARDVVVILGCAPSMGARCSGPGSGLFGRMACSSTQTHKHLNSKARGFPTPGDPTLAARATILSGRFMPFDMRLPVTWSNKDCARCAANSCGVVQSVAA